MGTTIRLSKINFQNLGCRRKRAPIRHSCNFKNSFLTIVIVTELKSGIDLFLPEPSAGGGACDIYVKHEPLNPIGSIEGLEIWCDGLNIQKITKPTHRYGFETEWKSETFHLYIESKSTICFQCLFLACETLHHYFIHYFSLFVSKSGEFSQNILFS